jgi:hypothetical protein
MKHRSAAVTSQGTEVLPTLPATFLVLGAKAASTKQALAQWHGLHVCDPFWFLGLNKTAERELKSQRWDHYSEGSKGRQTFFFMIDELPVINT